MIIRKIVAFITVGLIALQAFAGGWGDGGVVITDLGGTETANVAVVQPDGKVLAAGQSDDNMAIVRYNTNGTLDESFGSNGVVIVEYPLGWSTANDLKVLSSGKILVLGTTHNSSTEDIALVRLNSNGTLDVTFAGGGMIRSDFGPSNNTGRQMLLSADGSIFVADGSWGAHIYKYTVDGALDTSYGTDGARTVWNDSLYGAQGIRGFQFDGTEDDFTVLLSAIYSSSSSALYQLILATTATSAEEQILSFSVDPPWDNILDSGSVLKKSTSGSVGFCATRGHEPAGNIGHYGRYFSISYVDGTQRELDYENAWYLIYRFESTHAFTWMPDGSYFYDLGGSIKKFSGSSLDPTFGIGGIVSAYTTPNDLVPFGAERLLAVGTYSNDFCMSVYNADGSLYVDTPPVITSATSVTGEVDVAFSYTITADNDPVSFSATNLPAGLSLDTSSGTPEIVGTPTEAGTFVATVSASNSGGTGSDDVTFVIQKTSQTISFTNPGAKRLGDLPFVPDATASSGLDVTVVVDSGPASIIDGTVYLTDVGFVSLVASQTGSVDYAAASEVSVSFSVVYTEDAPTITSQPSDASSAAGAFAIFSVSAGGPQPYQYQWLKNGAGITNESESTLILSDIGFFDEGQYSCLVSNSFGYVLSSNAALNVTADPDAPDTDGDGISDQVEIYLSAFGLDPAVDSSSEWARLQAMVSEQELGGGYTADQMKDLAMGAPVLERLEDGKFAVQFNLLESDDLGAWATNEFQSGSVNVGNGVISISIDPADADTQFFKLMAKPSE